MWLLDFIWDVLQDFLIWGFLAKRVLRWLTPHLALLARLRAEHQEYVALQIASQSGEEREAAEVVVGFTARPVDCLPFRRRAELEFCLWLWGGALK